MTAAESKRRSFAERERKLLPRNKCEIKEKIEEENSYRSALNRRDADDNNDDRRLFWHWTGSAMLWRRSNIHNKQIQLEQQQQRQQRLPKMCILCQKTKNPTIFSLPSIALRPFAARTNTYRVSCVSIWILYTHRAKKPQRFTLWNINGRMVDAGWIHALSKRTRRNIVWLSNVLSDTFIGSANSRDRFFAFASNDRETTQNWIWIYVLVERRILDE